MVTVELLQFLRILGLSLMCLQCNNAAQPRHCHAITYCAEDEVNNL
jgi:hypothetical protein